MKGVESVRFASSPFGGYRMKGMASVGVSTSWVPGGSTIFFFSDIQRNLLSRWCGRLASYQDSREERLSLSPSLSRREGEERARDAAATRMSIPERIFVKKSGKRWER